MAPKKRAADADEPRASKFKCSDQRLPRSDAQPVADLNVAFTKELEGVIANVLDMYPDVQTEEAVSVTDGGSGATFNHMACEAALSSSGNFDFKGSLWLHDLRWRAAPMTPINVRGIQELVESRYARGPPDDLPFTVIIATDGFEDNVQAMDSHAGHFKRLSPEEPVFAFLFGCAMAKNDAEKGQYRRLMLSISYRLMSITGANEMRKESISIRERIRDDARAVRRTALSMLLLVVTQKQDLEKAWAQSNHHAQL